MMIIKVLLTFFVGIHHLSASSAKTSPIFDSDEGSQIYQTKCLFIYDSTRTGDTDQLKALEQEIKKMETIRVATYDISRQGDLAGIAARCDVLFAIGEKGLHALVELNKAHPVDRSKTFVAVSIHQYMPEITELAPNYLAIPKSAISGTTHIPESTYVTRTFAVPTQETDLAQLEEHYYDRWPSKELSRPGLDQPYIVVMLPGDAPRPDGTMAYFTNESADELAQRVEELRHELGDRHTVLVHNGPRTSQKNPATGGPQCNHIRGEGDKDDVPVDGVSIHFVNQLKSKNIPHRFFNFFIIPKGDGSQEKLSFFYPLLFIAQRSGNYFVLPGESISMLGQVTRHMPANRIITFLPSSMNEQHRAIVQRAFDDGYIAYWDGENQLNPKKLEKRESDTRLVVNDFVEALKKRR